MPARYVVLPVAVCCFIVPELAALQQVGAPEPCDQDEAAVRADSRNLEAAARLGRCAGRDYEMIAPGGDSSRLTFRSSWTTALRALRRAVELDPTYRPAYRPLFRILLATTRDGCWSTTGQCMHVSPVLRVDDSLVTVPRPVRNNPHPSTYDEVWFESQATQRANLTEARTIAERWAAAAPDDREPHEILGRVLLDLGEPEAASRELELAATLGTAASRRALMLDRVVALIRAERAEYARRLLDETAADTARDSTGRFPRTVSGLNELVGRHLPPPVDSARARAMRARVEQFIRRRPPPGQRPRSFAELLAAGDTVGARRTLAGMDSSMIRVAGRTGTPHVSSWALEFAEMHLALGDTADALAYLGDIDRALNGPNFRYALTYAFDSHHPWSGRAWLLAGDVAAAQGRLDDARRMYRRVVGLWAGGDPDLQPIVRRAQAKLNALPAAAPPGESSALPS
jgi:tetratricopeptide (TPR) repeat protein